jgi:glycosyltransferase involved in cell wall biosynthesis
MKIILYATYPTLSTGYARIANRIGNYLANIPGVDITHVGFEKYEGVTISDRFVDPRIRLIDVASRIDPAVDRFGTTLIKDVVEKEVRPDLVLIYNDAVVTSQMLNNFMTKDRPFKIVSYLDLVYEWECLEFLRHIDRWSDRIFVFSRFWKRHLIDDLKFDARKIGVFEHGFDADIFRPMDRAEARRALGLPPQNGYLVLNTNRNSYRKGLDVTIGGFLRFWKAAGRPDDVHLVLNCRLDVTDGFDIPNLVKIECLKLGLDECRVLDHHVLTLGDRSGLLTEAALNALYNACDVGLNTCVGEGFGLCNLEGAGLGIPQIVSDVGGLHDIFEGIRECRLLPARRAMYLARGIDSHGGEIRVCEPEAVAAALLDVYYASAAAPSSPPSSPSAPSSTSAPSSALADRIARRYHWPTLLGDFAREIVAPNIRASPNDRSNRAVRK